MPGACLMFTPTDRKAKPELYLRMSLRNFLARCVDSVNKSLTASSGQGHAGRLLVLPLWQQMEKCASFPLPTRSLAKFCELQWVQTFSRSPIRPTSKATT